MQTPIENADDLAAQHEIPYGVQRGGSTENFFRVWISLHTISSIETDKTHCYLHTLSNLDVQFIVSSIKVNDILLGTYFNI